MQLFWQPQFLPPNPGVNKNNTINIIKIIHSAPPLL